MVDSTPCFFGRVAALGRESRFATAVQDSAPLARQLGEERLLCVSPWPQLGSDPARFADEQASSAQMLTRPCNHRYVLKQWLCLADTIERLAPKPECILWSPS